jgi:hypothetical protein
MKIQILSGKILCPIQNNRCCLSTQMHNIFKGFKLEFSNFEMRFEEHLRQFQKLVSTQFLKKIDYDFLELSRRFGIQSLENL